MFFYYTISAGRISRGHRGVSYFCQRISALFSSLVEPLLPSGNSDDTNHAFSPKTSHRNTATKLPQTHVSRNKREPAKRCCDSSPTNTRLLPNKLRSCFSSICASRKEISAVSYQVRKRRKIMDYFGAASIQVGHGLGLGLGLGL